MSHKIHNIFVTTLMTIVLKFTILFLLVFLILNDFFLEKKKSIKKKLKTSRKWALFRYNLVNKTF